MKSIWHWIIFILRALLLLLLLPLALVFLWIRWRVARRSFIWSACESGIDRRAAAELTRILSPRKMLEHTDIL